MASVLMFNINDPEKIRQLTILSIRLNFACRVVPADQQYCLIRSLLTGVQGARSVPAFYDEMIVMDGLAGEDLNFLLNEMIRTGTTVSLKAVVTPTNLDWTAAQLHAQLRNEHQHMRALRSARSGGTK